VDWNIDSAVEIDATDAIGLRKFLNSPKAPLLLVSQAGQVAANWQYPTAPADVWLQMKAIWVRRQERSRCRMSELDGGPMIRERIGIALLVWLAMGATCIHARNWHSMMATGRLLWRQHHGSASLYAFC